MVFLHCVAPKTQTSLAMSSFPPQIGHCSVKGMKTELQRKNAGLSAGVFKN
jgi:hypothetical protein